MAITGLLSEFSLPEIFQFLEQGQKTGRLTLNPLSEKDRSKAHTHHIWFRQGNVITAANRLDGKGLLTLALQRGWLKEAEAALISESTLAQNSLGLFLKSRTILQAEQLKLLFYVQVMQQVCALFALTDAQFNFETQATAPMMEMTGLSSSGAEVTLAGLRALKDWNALANKLPEPTSALINVVQHKPHLNLNQIEWQVWEFTGGKQSLKAVAAQIQQPLEKIQQVAFRLIVVNLAEELPLAMAAPTEVKESEESSAGKSSNGLSEEFLKNLMGFLQGKS